MNAKIDINKRIMVTSNKIKMLKESLNKKSHPDVDPRLIKAAQIQTRCLIEELEKELKELKQGIVSHQ